MPGFHIAAIRAVGIAPEAVAIGVIHVSIPILEFDVADRTAERALDGTLEMPGADTLRWIIGAVVEI